MDLFTATPTEIQEIMYQTQDIEALRILARLEHAAIVGDELERFEAAGELADLYFRQG